LQPDLVGPSKDGKFVKLLKGKFPRVIISMGMPGPVYRWWFGSTRLKDAETEYFAIYRRSSSSIDHLWQTWKEQDFGDANGGSNKLKSLVDARPKRLE